MNDDVHYTHKHETVFLELGPPSILETLHPNPCLRLV